MKAKEPANQWCECSRPATVRTSGNRRICEHCAKIERRMKQKQKARAQQEQTERTEHE
jgi:hypothetical protein